MSYDLAGAPLATTAQELFGEQSTARGRRLRTFARLVYRRDGELFLAGGVSAGGLKSLKLGVVMPFGITYAEALALLTPPDAPAHGALAALRLRTDPVTVTDAGQLTRMAQTKLVVPLQDLSWAILMDLADAGPAMLDPDHWYPGVDDGIEPVPDEHVALVMAAMQRELDNERHGIRTNNRNAADALPALPLSKLPWRVQRAIAERRRLRYQQWGIGQAQWAADCWSLWDVADDPDWAPPFETSNTGYWLGADANWPTPAH